MKSRFYSRAQGYHSWGGHKDDKGKHGYRRLTRGKVNRQMRRVEKQAWGDLGR